MNKICEIINSLKGLRYLGGASDEQIQAAAKRIGVVFSEEYVSYLSKFGAITAEGIELTGIANSSCINVADVTLREREINKKMPKSMYVIENIGIDGLVILQNAKGEIFQISPNKNITKIFNSIAEYLSSKL